jgi:hypothetical protein
MQYIFNYYIWQRILQRHGMQIIHLISHLVDFIRSFSKWNLLQKQKTGSDFFFLAIILEKTKYRLKC